jgi:hypothetical protein
MMKETSKRVGLWANLRGWLVVLILFLGIPAAPVGAIFFWSDIRGAWSDMRSAVDSDYAARMALEQAETERKAAEKARRDAWQTRLAGAHLNCKDAVKQRSQYPTKAVFHRDPLDILRQQAIAPSAKTAVFRGRVDLMNSFGAMIPHRYACYIDVPNWRFTDIAVAPG